MEMTGHEQVKCNALGILTELITTTRTTTVAFRDAFGSKKHNKNDRTA